MRKIIFFMFVFVSIGCNRISIEAPKDYQSHASSAHVFIIDGMYYGRYYSSDVYVFVPRNPDERLPISFDPIRYETQYGQSFVRYVKMNWGWWTQWDSHTNDGWYALTGDWVAHVAGKDVNYHYTMKMLTGFNEIYPGI